MEDETTLRQLEQHFKLRVKTGCETCRTRRVKCDETKPSCLKCIKAGRTCGGYKNNRLKGSSPAAAAAYRNSSFLVVPQQPRSRPPTISRSPSISLSPEPQENRSFHYFQTHTLPRWTEFFDSEIWSHTMLQLSFEEPAIKHGILALSTMHENLEMSTLGTTSDIALVQYAQAVRHSNKLLSAHEESKASLEKILIACTIFTCFENLAGNYKAANMHLRNGLRILEQHRREKRTRGTESYEAIGNVLVRFDLQAMTFSDDTSPYLFGLGSAPGVPSIPEEGYTGNEKARDDLVSLSRCMLWAAGSVDANPQAIHADTFAQVYTQILPALKAWDVKFSHYAQESQEPAHSKAHAGKTLLRIYGIIMRTIASAGVGLTSEMAWDAYIEDFRTAVDLAETIPMLQPSQRASPHPPVEGATDPSSTYQPSPPTPSHIAGSRAADTLTVTFRSDTSSTPPNVSQTSISTLTPLSFSPSFELSPIVPLFLVATRCRDPLVRRRALALLLNYRRREGVWDSLAAGIVAAQCLKQEEGIADAQLGEGNWMPMAKGVRRAGDVPERSRLGDLVIEVDLKEGRIDMRCNGMQRERREEGRRVGEGMGIVTRHGTGAPSMSFASEEEEWS